MKRRFKVDHESNKKRLFKWWNSLINYLDKLTCIIAGDKKTSYVFNSSFVRIILTSTEENLLKFSRGIISRKIMLLSNFAFSFYCHERYNDYLSTVVNLKFQLQSNLVTHLK